MSRGRTAGARVFPAAAAAAALALALSACTSSGEPEEPELDRQPRAVGEMLPEANTAEVLLPTQFELLAAVEPAWGLDVQRGGEAFLSAQETAGALVFSAVSTEGEVLWTAERPLGCSGFAVTEGPAGTPLAVLTDMESTAEALSSITATAYDLETGQEAWGPVEVPGPHQGPGLLFEEPPEGYMGESPRTVVLDPSTGETLAQEDGERVLGEFDGTVVSDDSGTLRGRDHTEGTDWEVPADALGAEPDDLRAMPAAGHPGLLRFDAGEGTGPLIDEESGDLLSRSARDAAVDPGSGITVVLEDDALRFLDEDREEMGTVPASPSTELAALVGVLAYLREDGEVRVHNSITGSIAQAYATDGTGTAAVPDLVTPEGTGTLRAGERLLIATTRVNEPEVTED